MCVASNIAMYRDFLDERGWRTVRRTRPLSITQTISLTVSLTVYPCKCDSVSTDYVTRCLVHLLQLAHEIRYYGRCFFVFAFPYSVYLQHPILGDKNTHQENPSTDNILPGPSLHPKGLRSYFFLYIILFFFIIRGSHLNSRLPFF